MLCTCVRVVMERSKIFCARSMTTTIALRVSEMSGRRGSILSIARATGDGSTMTSYCCFDQSFLFKKPAMAMMAPGMSGYF